MCKIFTTSVLPQTMVLFNDNSNVIFGVLGSFHLYFDYLISKKKEKYSLYFYRNLLKERSLHSFTDTFDPVL